MSQTDFHKIARTHQVFLTINSRKVENKQKLYSITTELNRCHINEKYEASRKPNAPNHALTRTKRIDTQRKIALKEFLQNDNEEEEFGFPWLIEGCRN